MPASVPLGNRQAFLLPWVHARADACSFESTAKALIGINGVRLSPAGCGSSGMEHDQSFDNSFNHWIDLGQCMYEPAYIYVSLKIKDKQQMCLDY